MNHFKLEKRKYSALSPTQSASNPKPSKMSNTEDKRKVGDLTVDDLKFVINEVTKSLLTEVSAEVQLLANEVRSLRTENQEMKKEICVIKEESNSRLKEMERLEDQIKRKNIIIKGLPSSNSPNMAVTTLCTSTLHIDPQDIKIRSTRKIFDRNNKMGVIAELDTEEEVYKVLRTTNKLAGTQISIEKDLNSNKQEQKKVMLQLKREIGKTETTQKLTVRDERLRIGNKWFHWDHNQKLACGRENGVAEMEQIYGKRLDNIDFNYNSLLSKMNNMNRNRN